MKVVFILVSTLLCSTMVSAQENASIDQMCVKIKACSLEQLGPDSPPEVAQMMDSMFDGLCQSMLEPYYKSASDAGLQDKAEACADSFTALSCDVLMAGNDSVSPECDEFKKAADDAGIDVE